MEKITIALRLAEPEDLKIDNRNLRIGLPIWIRSMITGEFDNSPVILDEYTDPKEIAHWLYHKMIYVAVSALDVPSVAPEINRQQTIDKRLEESKI